MKCSKDKCDNEVAFRISLELRSEKGGPMARSSILLVVCKEHSNLVWNDVVTDLSWKLITTMFTDHNLTPPLKKFSAVSIDPYNYTTE